MKKITSDEIKYYINNELTAHMGVVARMATKQQVYLAVCNAVKSLLAERYAVSRFMASKQQKKQVYYLSMEFLPGTQLYNNVFNLGIENELNQALREYSTNLSSLRELEVDTGLGNGGLGRLASCYLDALTGQEKPAFGMSICYEHGIFSQRIENCNQVEEADNWLSNGECWLIDHPEEAIEITLGEDIILAVPRDLMISGYCSDNVNCLRLWSAKALPQNDLDIKKFAGGKYAEAMKKRNMAEAISQILYPEDGHAQGKLLRLSQQYFLASASMQYAVKKHMQLYGSVENFHEKNAVHINDTHPTLAIPELMRIFMDEYGMTFDKAWHIVNETVSYTNHTVLPEALEKWPRELMGKLLPRITEIIDMISDAVKLADEGGRTRNDDVIATEDEIRMANLCVAAAHKVNGVSAIHSGIIKDSLFASFAASTPDKFTNVTNGIAYRRWLCQANPRLTELISGLIGDGFKKDASQLERLAEFADDAAVLKSLGDIKKANKAVLADYVKRTSGMLIDTASIFDVQVKRLHEYKRQLLNLLHIMYICQLLRDNPNADVSPQTFIFGAKAASGYAEAKQIISLACNLSEEIERDPLLRSRIRVVFLENYSVSLSELVMPAAEVSEQISLAGKEASGTGNMKLMINGAITLGTEDGANVEIHRAVGDENIFIFGMSEEEVRSFKASVLCNQNESVNRAEPFSQTGYYNPQAVIDADERLKSVAAWLQRGVNGKCFSDLLNSLTTVNYSGMADQYLVLKEFDSYVNIQKNMRETYAKPQSWNRMSLINIAKAGMFSADRAITEYCNNIWGI